MTTPNRLPIAHGARRPATITDGPFAETKEWVLGSDRRSVREDAPPIEVAEIVAWSGPATSCCAPLDGDPPRVAVNDLRRSLEFYSRVFGFLAERLSADLDTAMLATATRVRLVLHEGGTPPASRRPLRRWGFVVTDLDRIRELVWDLGVKVARDSGDPDHIYRQPNRRSLYVHDPDRNEIELVELAERVNVIPMARRA